MSKAEMAAAQELRLARDQKLKEAEEIAARQKAIQDSADAQREQQMVNLRFKLEELQTEYDTFVKEQQRTWGAKRDRTKELEMEAQLNEWKDELNSLLNSNKQISKQEDMDRLLRPLAAEVAEQQTEAEMEHDMQQVAPQKAAPADLERMPKWLVEGIPEQYRDQDWKRMKAEERQSKITELDQLQDNVRTCTLEMQLSFSSRRSDLAELARQEKINAAARKKLLADTSTQLKMAVIKDKEAQKELDDRQNELKRAEKQRSHDHAVMTRTLAAEKTVSLGAALNGTNPELILKKQQEDAKLYAEVKQLEHLIHDLREKEMESRKLVSYAKRHAKFDPSPAGERHLSETIEQSEAAKKGVQKALEQLAGVEQRIEDLWKIPQEEMTKEVMRCNKTLKESRLLVSKLQNQVGELDLTYKEAKDKRAAMELEAEVTEQKVENERITAKLAKDQKEQQLAIVENQVKAARILERDLNALLKKVMQEEERYKNWRGS